MSNFWTLLSRELRVQVLLRTGQVGWHSRPKLHGWEERHVQPEDGGIQDEFPAYGIHVYGPLPVAQKGQTP